MIKRLLVANRGEIAVRIMATASVLGIETVAVYAADDAACGHVGRADAAVELPGPGAAAYFDADAVVAAAISAGCDTLHPGSGPRAVGDGAPRCGIHQRPCRAARHYARSRRGRRRDGPGAAVRLPLPLRHHPHGLLAPGPAGAGAPAAASRRSCYGRDCWGDRPPLGLGQPARPTSRPPTGSTSGCRPATRCAPKPPRTRRRATLAQASRPACCRFRHGVAKPEARQPVRCTQGSAPRW
jgi:Biotin carboxylase, N-terminal domain